MSTVLRTKDGYAWRPVEEIGSYHNRSVAQAAKDIFDEAVVSAIEDVGFTYDELAARLRHIEHWRGLKGDAA